MDRADFGEGLLCYLSFLYIQYLCSDFVYPKTGSSLQSAKQHVLVDRC
ncbi:hypothetical protein LEP1GSC038_2203 [Leptospira weilii str. 2006001855]|uniref:Uncharacterized protein n=1 Tax=Leptospira weilii str. 2006001855 TaxID=996804 RepID=M6FUX1_9LEPT|nr:hypothetical protein LEP1GSC051_0763 [Leptospira sp. P2653]EMM73879.1 hypothetical protein LEP1GSC038_2203 [Leptospira weilii str. 2006001855]EMN42464.1 hypothetical protein LEP1GSC086_1542 [Leptospira weilii str. LNT 1234]